MSTVTKVIMWVILAAIAVLVIKNSSGFTNAVGAVGTQSNNLVTTLTGSGYKGAGG